MAQLTRTELKALLSGASSEYTAFWDAVFDSLPTNKNDELVYRARIFGNASGIVYNNAQKDTLGVSVTWSRTGVGQYQCAVGGGLDWTKLNVRLTPVYNSTGVLFQVDDEDAPVYKVFSMNSASGLVDGAIFYIEITYNP